MRSISCLVAIFLVLLPSAWAGAASRRGRNDKLNQSSPSSQQRREAAKELDERLLGWGEAFRHVGLTDQQSIALVDQIQYVFSVGGLGRGSRMLLFKALGGGRVTSMKDLERYERNLEDEARNKENVTKVWNAIRSASHDGALQKMELRSMFDLTYAQVDKLVEAIDYTATQATPLRENTVKEASYAYTPISPLEEGYRHNVGKYIAARWKVLESMRGNGYEANVKIYLARNGSITGWNFRGSGNPLFDEEVKRTLDAASPVPAPPAGLPARGLEQEIHFSSQ